MPPKSTMPQGRVLVIAGSDSGGGAGIQADIKTITALGGYATSSITALTVQDTLKVHEVQTISPAFVTKQAEAVLNDIGADCIKTGMLANEEIILAVAALARKYPQIPLIVDPVMVATSGDLLLQRSALQALTEHLLPLANLVTPNIAEAELLAHILITTEVGMKKAAASILKNYNPQAVLIKGGHLRGEECVDVYLTQSQHFEDAIEFRSDRIDSQSTHGTGCTLASAIATHISLGDSVPTAIEKARLYVQGGITHSQNFGKGHSPLHHGWNIKQ